MDKLTDNIRIRIDTKTRQLIEREATSRRLKMADILREAIHQYLDIRQKEADHASETLAARQGF